MKMKEFGLQGKGAHVPGTPLRSAKESSILSYWSRCFLTCEENDLMET